MKKIMLVIVLISPLLATGQIKDSSNFFISAEIEYFIISQKNIGNTTYSAINGIGYGVGSGYAVLNNFFIVVSYTYVPQKEMIENHGIGDGGYNILIKQSLLKIGVQYNIIVNKSVVIGLLGGINRTKVEEESYTKENNELSSSLTGSILGCFLGLTFEKGIVDLPLSIYGKTQYFGGDILGFLNVPDIGTRIGFQFGLGIKYSF